MNRKRYVMWKIPNTVTKITRFYVKQHMPPRTTSVEIPENSYVDPCAFLNCTGIQKIVIHMGVTIGISAFQNCTGLQKLVIHQRVKIGFCAFQSCTGLQTLELSEGANLSDNAFLFCIGIKLLIISKNVWSSMSSYSNCSGIKTLIISEGAHINKEALQYSFLGLTKVFVPNESYRELQRAGFDIITYQDVNDFCSNKKGLKNLESINDKIHIYNLCHTNGHVVRDDFEYLSSLSVSTILDVIQAYSEVSGNTLQSEQLRHWVMGTGLPTLFNHTQESELKEYLSFGDWIKMRRTSKNMLRRQHSGFFPPYSQLAAEVEESDEVDNVKRVCRGNQVVG